ncbi:hypothetical protein EMCRGX_G029530 [Ephydatia muelleri]
MVQEGHVTAAGSHSAASSNEGQLGACLRAVYEGEEVEAFQNSLANRIKVHEKDIERMCNKNYQGFIESVSELLKVKADAGKIKKKVQEANRIIGESGQQLMKSTEELRQYHAVQKNILGSIEALGLCMPVLELYGKLLEQMAAKQYYHALKTLEQLEHTFLPRVKGYTFTDLLSNGIPQLRENIQKESWKELTDFLAMVREKSEYIGEVAMQQAARNHNLELAQEVRKPLTSTSIDPEGCAQDVVDFSPVYRGLHIHSVLGKKDHFTEDYRTQRKSQVRLAIKPHGSWNGEIDDYKKYFFNIVGFFVVEDTILHTCQSLAHKGTDDEGLVTRSLVHDFWHMAVSELLAVLRANSASCTDYHLILKVKQLVVWFCHTLKGYGFEVVKLNEVLLEMRDHYDELLMKAWGESFKQIFDMDTYSPLVVTTEPEYLGVTEVFPYQAKDPVTKQSCPVTFPFSVMVPQVYSQLQEFVCQCTSYADQLDLSQTDIDECVRKSVNLLLSRVLSECLAKLIQRESLTVPYLTQIWVNLNHLEGACVNLEKFIAEKTRTGSEGVNAPRLYGVSAFQEAKHFTERKITDKLCAKVAEVLEGATYNWLPKEAISTTSDYLGDCFRYVTSNLDTMRSMPPDALNSLTSTILLNVATAMEAILLSDKNPRVNLAGIASFGLDLQKCEEHLRECEEKMPSLTASEAKKVFTRLRELVNMFVQEDWSVYVTEFQDTHGQKKYPNVTPKMVYNLLYKFREGLKHGKSLLRSSKDEKKKHKVTLNRSTSKKAMMKAVLRKLEELSQESMRDRLTPEKSDASIASARSDVSLGKRDAGKLGVSSSAASVSPVKHGKERSMTMKASPSKSKQRSSTVLESKK